MNPLAQLLEAALFAADRPIAAEDLAGLAPDATLAELNAAWQTEFGRPVGQTSIWKVLNEHKLRRKKK